MGHAHCTETTADRPTDNGRLTRAVPKMVPGTNIIRRHSHKKIRRCPVVAATAVAHAFAVCIVASCSRGCRASTTAAVVGRSASFTAASSFEVFTSHTRYHSSALGFVGGGGSSVRRSSSTLFAGGMERRLTLQEESCSSSSKAVMMGPARGKRGATGRPASRNGVGKKVRRILEPASPAEVSHCPVVLVSSQPSWQRGAGCAWRVSTTLGFTGRPSKSCC